MKGQNKPKNKTTIRVHHILYDAYSQPYQVKEIIPLTDVVLLKLTNRLDENLTGIISNSKRSEKAAIIHPYGFSILFMNEADYKANREKQEHIEYIQSIGSAVETIVKTLIYDGVFKRAQIL